CMQYTHIPWTF
nr:immunoglobulin light chain junction region [Macaca mulatta]MOV93259.1 immunoglobulin light chain junction region [Macaca mulatta]MOW33911.1 immunoglobulin light chain junction region [Macaca mulatta]MOW35411.1 immunoglobulin light chain junction region [Macaca mulatta]MOW65801.1 immunoglobulin light chain junction region [Macaca mulatta]